MNQPGVFICPSCQAVVRSEKKPGEALVCGQCQHEFGEVLESGGAVVSPAKLAPLPRSGDPNAGKSAAVVRNLTAKRAPVVRVPGAAGGAPIAARSYEEVATEGAPASDEIILPDGSRRVKRRKKRPSKEKNKPLILFLVGWLSVVVIIFALFKTKSESASGQKDDEAEVDITATRDRQLIETHRDEISKLLRSYLLTTNLDERLQYIDRSSELSLNHARYYRAHSFFQPELPMGIIGSKVIEISEEPLVLAIEFVWQDSANRRFGTVYRHDGEGWKLDWEAFAPYSTDSWARFQARLGLKEGIFRVLVRKRASSDESKRIYLSFYRPPEFGEEDKGFLKTESQEVEVILKSQMGKQFMGMWTDFEEGVRPYGSILPLIDPEGFMRITARLAWEEVEGSAELQLVLKEIIDPSWYGESIQEAFQKAREKDEVSALKNLQTIDPLTPE